MLLWALKHCECTCIWSWDSALADAMLLPIPSCHAMPRPLFLCLLRSLQATSPLCWGSAVSRLAGWPLGLRGLPALQAALAALPGKPP